MRHPQPLLILLLVGAAACGRPEPHAPPDLILAGGTVYTLDEARPWAEAVAITGDRITAVGPDAEIRALAGPATRVIDLAGAFALPGFNDGHVHIDSTGALLTGVNLLDVHDADGFTERIQAATTRLPAGSWITRGDWGAYEQWEAGSAGAGGAGGAGGVQGRLRRPGS
jgi:predicted amidohydrolase YtcJ